MFVIIKQRGKPYISSGQTVESVLVLEKSRLKLFGENGCEVSTRKVHFECAANNKLQIY